jgi:beta-glucanase (GH16 family)
MKYGRVEVTARLPRGDWLWPAIWLMPTSAAYGQWPASGEIDIMESRGNARGYPGGGAESASSTLHFGPFWPEDGYASAHAQYSAPTGDLTTDFHVYGLFWNSSHMYTCVNGGGKGVAVVWVGWGGGGWAMVAVVAGWWGRERWW